MISNLVSFLVNSLVIVVIYLISLCIPYAFTGSTGGWIWPFMVMHYGWVYYLTKEDCGKFLNKWNRNS